MLYSNDECALNFVSMGKLIQLVCVEQVTFLCVRVYMSM